MASSLAPSSNRMLLDCQVLHHRVVLHHLSAPGMHWDAPPVTDRIPLQGRSSAPLKINYIRQLYLEA
jgi:hypothetical protein